MLRTLIYISTIAIISLFYSSCSILKKSEEVEIRRDTREKVFNFNSFLLEGARQKSLGNYDAALNNYLFAIRIDSTQPAVYFEISGILTILRDFSGALEYAQKAVEIDKNNNEYYRIRLALLYQQNGMLSKSAEVFEELIKINPNDLNYYFELTDVYVSVGNKRRAIRTLNEAEKVFGIQDYISLEKERIHRLMGNDSRAIREIEKLAETYPNNHDYKIILAEAYIKSGNIDEAKSIYDNLKDKHFDKGVIYFSIADFYRSIEDFDNTFLLLQRGFAAQDVDVDIKLAMMINMVAYMGQDEYIFKNAAKLMEVLLTAYPNNVQVRTLYTDFLIYDNKYKEAQKEFDFILKNEKGEFLFWEQALFIDNSLADYEAMFRRSKEAIEYFPNQPILYLFYSLSSLFTENYDDAVRAGQLAVNIIIDDDEMLTQILAFKAEAYKELDKIEKSDKIFEKVLEIDPKYTMVLNNYSYYLALREENLDKALEMSTKLMTLDTTNAAFLDTHAWVLYKNGKYEEALEWIIKAVNKNADSPIHLEHKGDILYKLSEKDKALKYWKKALEKGEGSEFLEKKVEKKTLIE